MPEQSPFDPPRGDLSARPQQPYGPPGQYGQQPPGQYGQQYGQQQPPYGAPAWGAPVPGTQAGYGSPYGGPPSRGTNGMAIASLVLGILWLYWVGSVLALVFGYVARKQIRERGESGDGLAVAGIVLGWIGVGVFALFMLFGVLAVAAGY